MLPKTDALGIVEAVKHLRDKEPLLRQLSEGALQFYQQHFDWETNARKLEQFYKSLLNEPTSSAQEAGGCENNTWPAESSTGQSEANEVTRGEARPDLPRAQ